MADDHPDMIRLSMDLDCESFAQACQIAVRALNDHRLLVATWAIPSSAPQRKTGLQAALEKLATDLPKPDRETLLFVLADGASGEVFQPPGAVSLALRRR